jgi:DNA-directed RNA polymerase subunit RPC12/RpoP
MTEITIIPIGEPAGEAKFGFIYTQEELRHWAQFNYSSECTVLLVCQNCQRPAAPSLAYVSKYKEFDCQHCGAKNDASSEFYIPDARQTFWTGKGWLSFWKD